MNTNENLMQTQSTLDYYNKNAAVFTADTVAVEFTELQNEFLSYLSEKSAILDLGCGSGRDSKYFIDRGFDVTSVDGSEELCKIACKLTGKPVINTTFQNYVPDRMFDGIWACSSLLHLSQDELIRVVNHIAKYLNKQGVFYMSFKYGNFEGMRNGRFFLDLNENSFSNLIANIVSLSLIKIKITSDVRPRREQEKWLNVFLKKAENL